MVNEIIKGISVALYENFNPVNIYTDKVEQGFETPAFFIRTIRSSESRLLGNRAKRQYTFSIHYYSESRKNEELQEVASKLYGILRQIKLLNGDSLNGLKLEHEVVNGVLLFFVRYNPIVHYASEVPETFGELDYNLNEVK